MFFSKAIMAFIALSLMWNGENARAQSLLINEIQVANTDQFIDPSYNYGGWMEVYNSSDNFISLKGLVVRNTNEEGKVEQYMLTASHGSVPAHGFSVLWFDHNSVDGYFGGKASSQIPYKLDADGGVLELLDAYGNLIDVVEYPQCVARCSWMRQTDGAKTFGWTATPTPKASNNASAIASERLLPPNVSIAGGTFDDRITFSVNIPEGCKLYYTTDGSAPEPNQSKVSTYGYFRANEDSIFRFMLTREGFLNSPVVTHSFFKSRGQFSLPILSVNTAPKNLFDNTIGLYVIGTNGRVANNSKVKANQNMDWDRPVNVEYFVPDSNEEYCVAINQEANFSIFGGWSRFNAGNQDFQYRTSFKLKSDKVFEGKNSFDYPLFVSKPHVKIKNFLVRNGGQDRDARISDGAIHELLRTSGVYIDCQAWQPAQVFLDGKYLGMMNLREESNKQFAFSNYGIDTNEMDQWEADIIIKEGDKKALNEWYNLSIHLAENPADTAVWDSICRLVDIDEYCNYMAAEIYIGNADWLRGGFKNLKGFRAKDDGGKFHIVLHDVDGCFGDTDMLIQVLKKGTGSLPVRFKNMLKYEPFRKQFIDTYCLMNGSVFEPERCTKIISAMRDAINPALQLEGLSANEKAEQLITRIGDYEVRRPALKQSLVTAFDLKDEINVSLQANTPEARLMLNDMEVPTGRFKGYLFPPISLTTSAPDGWIFKEWKVGGESFSTDSVLCLGEEHALDNYDIEAVYEQIETHHAPIRINEVSAGNDIFINDYGKKADWVELYNNSDSDFDLSGAYLSDDPQDLHKYQIPSSDNISTIIPAHGYKVIWCDGKDLGTQMHASFKLKNSDEAFVSITDASDAWTDSLHYKEQPRWHTFGRFPDGGNALAMFERPTIGNVNRTCTGTDIEVQHDNIVTSVVPDIAERRIIDVRYYNIKGQQITNIKSEHIVIQQRIYDDGTQTTRKITFAE